MSSTRRASRAIGLLRSLAVYHGIPMRQRRLRRLYATLAAPGDLTFDLGAHAGNRTRALAAVGCRVVALEPQPSCRKTRTIPPLESLYLKKKSLNYKATNYK